MKREAHVKSIILVCLVGSVFSVVFFRSAPRPGGLSGRPVEGLSHSSSVAQATGQPYEPGGGQKANVTQGTQAPEVPSRAISPGRHEKLAQRIQAIPAHDSGALSALYAEVAAEIAKDEAAFERYFEHEMSHVATLPLKQSIFLLRALAEHSSAPLEPMRRFLASAPAAGPERVVVARIFALQEIAKMPGRFVGMDRTLVELAKTDSDLAVVRQAIQALKAISRDSKPLLAEIDAARGPADRFAYADLL